MREVFEKGTIVQIDPTHENKMFAGCLMIVTEVKSWGLQGYISCPESKDKMPGVAYFRCKKEECEPVGHVVWTAE